MHNGLLLVATLDAAFDAVLISFGESGQIMISEKLSKEDQEASGISPDMHLSRVNDEVIKRLEWHQINLFEL